MIHWAWLGLAFVAGTAFGFLGLIRLIEFIAELGELPSSSPRVAADHPGSEERQAPEAQGREAAEAAKQLLGALYLINLLKAASHALRSYEFGNSDPTSAKHVADQIDAAIAERRATGPQGGA